MDLFNAYCIKIYNYIISRSWINMNNPFCRRMRKALFHNICHECRANFGKLNAERIFYVIRCPQEQLGFFGLFNYVVYHLKIASSINAEPAIDWQYYPNNYVTEDNLVGKENAWEYFFEQTTDITLHEVYRSRNVIMSHGNGEGSLEEVYHPNELKKSHELVKKYIRLNSVTYQHVEKEYQNLGIQGQRIMGIKCRGTDFVETKPRGHSICPTAKETYDKIKELESVWGEFDGFFIATEDANILSEMEGYLGDKLIYIQEKRFESVQSKWLSQVYDDKKSNGHKYDDMLAYLSSIYILASCDALVAPVIGATLGAMRIKGIYENCFFFQLGIHA